MLQPKKVKDIDLSFGGKTEVLLPNYDEIPDEFKNEKTKWNKYINDWFYMGIKIVSVTPKDGIDIEDALRHIKAALVSFQIKHEHKMAGCAYLLSEFFDEFDYEIIERE